MMLYDWTGKQLEDAAKQPAEKRRLIAKRLVHFEPGDRLEADVSGGLTPETLGSIFQQANHGDPAAQARLAAEIEEKDWDTIHALNTRRDAVLGLETLIRPVKALDKDRKAIRVAKELDDALDHGLIADAVSQMLSALLSGYSLSEIMWDKGGANVLSIDQVPTSMIGFYSSLEPRIVSRTNSLGSPLAPNKFLWHVHRARSGDATRGGLIRPLGWMFLFSALGVKGGMRLIEKFGMPFVSARVDDDAWEKDRDRIAYLVRNFGSDGGAVFSKAVELEFLEGKTDSGDIYFRLLEYFGAAKTKVILGQTATSGDGAGFSKGQAQAEVREDIMLADCKAVARSFRKCILTPLVAFRYGPDVPVPDLAFDTEETEDIEQRSKILVNLRSAGFEFDEAEQSAAFNMTLRRAAVPAAGPAMAFADKPSAEEQIVEKALEQAAAAGLGEKLLTPLAEAIAEALNGLDLANPSDADERELRTRLSALLDQIPALYEAMDAGPLEDLIARAAFAADANGRAAAVRRVRPSMNARARGESE